jgi:HEAT repeat protein
MKDYQSISALGKSAIEPLLETASKGLLGGAARGLGSFFASVADSSYVPQLLAMLQNKERFSFAATALGVMQVEEAVPHLLKYIGGEDAQWAVAEIGDEAALVPLTREFVMRFRVGDPENLHAHRPFEAFRKIARRKHLKVLPSKTLTFTLGDRVVTDEQVHLLAEAQSILVNWLNTQKQ